jgi:hypothetical protein
VPPQLCGGGIEGGYVGAEGHVVCVFQFEKARAYKPTRFTHGTTISSENQGENPAFLQITQNGGTTITGKNIRISK